ncbi:MAG: polysaccharide biosynthesis tyrosine autokinase [Jatrophihabitans sp.]|uniref:polysaccharide biosynthesis tyrosine autokinase n=1 Tax=Jatrophihabitans sp. TaxID=1932789 RepID=UPI003F7FF12A
MTLKDYWRIFVDRWRVVATFVVLSLGLAVLITALSPKSYQATAQVFVVSNQPQDATGNYTGVASVLAQVPTYAQLIDDPKILRAVKSDLNLPDDLSTIAGKLSASAPNAQAIIDVAATDPSASRAAAIANSAADAFATVIEGYSTPSSTTTPTVKLYTTKPADAPGSPVSPKTTLNIAIGLLLGLLVGLALAVMRELLDNRVKSVDDLSKYAGASPVGLVSEDDDAARHPVAALGREGNVRAENFRQLRANLQFANLDSHPRVIAVTSPMPGEGKTAVAINLAHTLAEAGFTVCLIDADLRRPTVAKLLGLPTPVGLTNVLLHQLDLSEALQSAGAGLQVLSSGPTPPNPSEVLASSYVRELIRSLLTKVDYVVVDTAPLLPVADGAEVAAMADGALLVARYARTTDAQVKQAAAVLGQVDATLLGVVLNRVPSKKRGGYAYDYASTTGSPGAGGTAGSTGSGVSVTKPGSGRLASVKKSS